MYKIILYRTANGKTPVKEYLEKLSKESKEKEIAQIKLYIDRLKEDGMSVNHKFPETIRREKGDVYALRPGSNRVFFFYYCGNEIVLLHAYKKQSQKAPQKELKKAEKEMKDYIERNKNGKADN